MENILNIASYIAQRYQHTFGEVISEMKLHKLLYFTQRECLIRKDEIMFPDVFYAWKYGPVMPVIRTWYACGMPAYHLSTEAQNMYQQVFDFIFEHYAPKEAWSLSRLTHGEYSWQIARKGLGEDDNGTNPLLVENIRRDAAIAKMRRIIVGKMNTLG